MPRVFPRACAPPSRTRLYRRASSTGTDRQGLPRSSCRPKRSPDGIKARPRACTTSSTSAGRLVDTYRSRSGLPENLTARCLAAGLLSRPTGQGCYSENTHSRKTTRRQGRNLPGPEPGQTTVHHRSKALPWVERTIVNRVSTPCHVSGPARICQAWAVGLRPAVPSGGCRPQSKRPAGLEWLAVHGLVVVVASAALATTIVRVSWAAER